MFLEGKVVKPRLPTNYLFTLIKKMWILSTVDKIFWVLVLYPIFLAVGPWSIGYLVEDHIGAVFAWGIFINGAHLPGSVTYEIGVIQVSLLFVLSLNRNYISTYKKLLKASELWKF